MSYYVTNENSFLDVKNAHLRVTGNVHTDVLKLGAIEFQPTGSEVTGTVNFTNVTTGVTTSSNLSVGGTLTVGTFEVVATTHTLANTTARGNVTPHTILFSNVTTGIVTTANVSVGNELTVTGNVAVDTDTLFVDSVNDRVGIGTSLPADTLHVNGGIRFAGHIIPTQNATFDIGSATNKVRDLFLHNNSLWIGDQSKIAFSDGKLKFQRRKLDNVPKVVKDLAIANGLTDEAEVATYAVAFANAIDPTITEVADLKLEHWRDYTQTFDSTKAISDIFVDNYEDYEAVAAADAFMEVGSNIFTTHSVSIGSSADPQSNLHVTGDAIITGNLTVDTNTLFVDSVNDRVGIGTDSPIRKLEAVGNQDENGEYSFSAGVGQANTYETRIYIGTDVASNSSNRLAKCALITEPYTSPSNWGRQKLHFCLKDTTGVYNDNATVSDAKMTLLPTGNVGIGTTVPKARLHVNHDLHLEATSEAWNGTVGKGLYFRYSLSGGQDGAYIQSIDRGNTSLKYSMNFDASSYTFNTGNVDVSGYILNAARPAFWAFQSAGASTTTIGANGFNWNSTDVNVGSCFSTTTNAFTAPVNGYYHFFCQGLSRRGTGSGSIEMTLYKNGVNVSGRALAYEYMRDTSDHSNTSYSRIEYMTANQTMKMGATVIPAGTDIYYGERLGYFSGYLLG